MSEFDAMKAYKCFLDFIELGRAEKYKCEEVMPVAHPINRGLGGKSLLVEDERSLNYYFIKVIKHTSATEESFIDTVNLMETAYEINLAPKLIDFEEEKRFLLVEGLTQDWSFGTVKIFRNTSIIRQAISALKKLHKTQPLKTKRTVFDRINKLKSQLYEFSSKSDRYILPEFYYMMADYNEQIEELIEARGFEVAPCKGELNLSDFMFQPSGELNLVDFDLASNGDPLSDLAYLANEICRDEEDLKHIIFAYTNDNREEDLNRLKLYMIANSFFLGLWGLVEQLRSPASEIEFFKYGQNQFLRCRFNIGRWNFNNLIRNF
ncbi:MAG: aminoglycoside phosphotransferase family protein [Paracoccaceae bacterium]|nr:aminoglycoside phosphotransferase family protein [Paracoccaceae bacterium]